MSVKIVDTLVGVIHFAKFGSNRLLIVWELRKQRNANKCRKIAYSLVVKKMKNRNLAHKFLYRALVRVNACKYAKFQVPSSISYGDMEGVPE